MIDDECRYYKLTQEAKLQIQYAVPSIQRQALAFKLKQIQAAKEKLNTLLSTIKKRIKHQNDTLYTYYQVDSLIQKLDDAQRDIRVSLAIDHPLKIEYIKLDELLTKLGMAQKKRESTRNNLEKQKNWSVQVQAGAQQYLPFNHTQTVQPYVALFLRYNLGSLYNNNKIDESLTRYTDWKSKRVNGVQKQLFQLINSINLLLVAEQERLKHLQLSYQKYDGLSKQMHLVDSIKASRFSQRIEIDRLMMDIEIKYVKYMVELLRGVAS